MTILVTGAAGYIGSVVTAELAAQNHRVIALDNLKCGHRTAVHEQAEFVKADLLDREALNAVFETNEIEAVIHLAAESQVGPSMTDPGLYFRVNVTGGLNLLDAMATHGTKDFIFSSTAAVYGDPRQTPIKEIHPLEPINSYGESKLIFERMLDWYRRAHGLRYVILRYFNAAGASADYGEDHDPETHLIPLVLRAALEQNHDMNIFGTDYPTDDGSCIRDYIHVSDISQAHILAMDSLEKHGSAVYNLGNSSGYSVLEVIKAAEQVTGSKIPLSYLPRRPGDPAVLVADNAMARERLGWQPQFPEIESIIESAWQWHRQHPEGYEKLP